MSNELPNNVKLKEYENQKELAAKADSVLRTVSAIVEKEFGTEEDGVTFMPALNILCQLKDDPTSDVDPVSFSVVKRPHTSIQIDNIVNHILLKDSAFLSSIMQGVASILAEMMSVHFDITSLVQTMEEAPNENNEVETDENKGKNSESKSTSNIQGFKKIQVRSTNEKDSKITA